jgi:hypothetical protein
MTNAIGGADPNANANLAKWTNERRDWWNRNVGRLSVVLAFLSVCAGLYYGRNASDLLKALILFGWILCPPVFFWCDWVFLCKDIPRDKVDNVKHLHDLSRNIWVALVVILLALFKVTELRP